eukprot:954709-Rhodomonas_salina.1
MHTRVTITVRKTDGSQVSSAICLRVRYALSGTDGVYGSARKEVPLNARWSEERGSWYYYYERGGDVLDVLVPGYRAVATRLHLRTPHQRSPSLGLALNLLPRTCYWHVSPCTLQTQVQETVFLAQIVLKMRFLGFHFGVYALTRAWFSRSSASRTPIARDEESCYLLERLQVCNVFIIKASFLNGARRGHTG